MVHNENSMCSLYYLMVTQSEYNAISMKQSLGKPKNKNLIKKIRYPKQTPKSNKTGSLGASVHELQTITLLHCSHKI